MMSMRRETIVPALLAWIAFVDVCLWAGNAQAAPPSAQIVQVLVAGKAGVPKDFDASALFSMGDYLYAVGPHEKPAIHYFKRDSSNGSLAYAGGVPFTQKECSNTMACVAGSRLYVLLTRWANETVDNRLMWYDVDATTGKPQERGTSPKLTWTDQAGHAQTGWGRMLVAGGDQKNIYVALDRAVLSFRIDADGTPVPVGQLNGKGVGDYVFAAPGGKWLYTMTHDPVPAIACIQCGPAGEIALKSVVKLDPAWGARDCRTEFSMSMTPDGKWLYAADWNLGQYEPEKDDTRTTNSYLAVLRRDPATGGLELADAGCGNDSTRPDLKLANSRQLRLVFNGDGKSGFISTASGSLLRSFDFDARTGRIDALAEFPEWDTRRLETQCLWIDTAKGLLYGASGRPFGPAAVSVGAETHGMWVARIGSQPPAPAITSVLTGSATAKAPDAAADWPCWRGPTHDLKSPMRGIRKDWAGGLRKIWEVRGLSPGAHTWSVPAIQGNRLVVSGRQGFVDRFFCFDADKGGEPIWTADIEGGEAGHFDWGSGSHAMAAMDGDKVFVANLYGIVAGLSMSDGKVLWKRLLGGTMYTASPLVYDDLVIYAGGNNYWHGIPLIAYHKDTGTVAWTYGQKSKSNSSPLLAKIDGRDQVIHLDQFQLFGVDPRTGKEIWRFHPPEMEKSTEEGSPISTPAIDGNILFPAWPQCPTVEIDGDSVKELWKRFSGGKHRVNSNAGTLLSDGVVIDGYMYHFAGGGSGYANDRHGWLVCTELKTGKVQWLEEVGNGSLLAVDDCLLCLTYAGDLLLVKPAPSKFIKLAEIKGFVTRDLWIGRQATKLNDPDPAISYDDNTDYAPCWAPPAVARGKLYVHYSDRLACYDLMSP